MICVSIGDKTLDEILGLLKEIEMAEIRIDLCNLESDDVRVLFGAHPRLIATCRPGKHSDSERIDLLLIAIGAGAAYVDIDLDDPDYFRTDIIDYAKQHKC
ncbi:MAG: type I 3-dehydroquinate dehydratase, partial [Bacteroidetes bacterium]|nr:type I 3-dehydroquinate dehydratase [Bacteroidota bacterium]